MHVVLVGMMGAGKSTVGKRLAKRLDRPFVDADHDLEARLGRTVAEVFEQDGEDAFRTEEALHLHRLLAAAEPTVVAAGGGVVLRADNRARLREDDVMVVWLDAAPAFLASRAEAKPHRPLLAQGQSPRVVFERLDGERRQLYQEVADVAIDVQPFHDEEPKPKRAMAERLAELVLARESAADGAAP